MKENARSQINQITEHFLKRNFPAEARTVGDVPVLYFVFPQTMEPNLPDFAMRMTNTDPQTHEVYGIFGVSESVPPELRPYWAAHEIIEFTEIGIDTTGRCALAEERVADLVPDNLKDAYLARRTKFFLNLRAYFQNDINAQKGNYSNADLAEAESSLAYLRSFKIKGLMHSFLQRTDEDLLALEETPELKGYDAELDFYGPVMNAIKLIGTKTEPSRMEEIKRNIDNSVILIKSSDDSEELIGLDFKIFYAAGDSFSYRIRKEKNFILVFCHPEGYEYPSECWQLKQKKDEKDNDSYVVINKVAYNSNEKRYVGKRFYTEKFTASQYLT